MNAGTATRKRLIGWGLALVATCAIYRGGFVDAMASHTRVGDFFQEWASARNYWEGLPIYTPQAITAWRYLQYRPDYSKSVFVGINGHPPACVLVSLPLGRLSYSDAFLLWNLLAIGAALATAACALKLELGTIRTWYWLPLLTLLISNSFLQQLMMGQLSIFLSLMIVGTAWADARNRPLTAGLLLGLAASLKLFPGLLVLYFVLHRKWRTCWTAAATFAAVNLACAALFGWQTFDHFLRYSMPEVLRYRDWWANYSLTGWWFKLFDASSGQTLPLWSSATLARIGSLACMASVIGAAIYATVRARPGAARRSGLAIFTYAMVLATPVAWDHYYLLLLWPLTHGLTSGSLGPRGRIVVAWALATLWLNPLVLYSWMAKPGEILSGWSVLLVLSWPCYALLALAGLQWRQAVAPQPATATAPAAVPPDAVPPDAVPPDETPPRVQPAAGG